MNPKNMYDDEDEEDEEDDICEEDLEELRRACIIPDPNSSGGGESSSDSENEDDFEMLQSIKTQLASSTSTRVMGSSSVISDSESEDDFEMLRSIKTQLAMPMDEDDDRALQKRFSVFDENGGNCKNDSPGKKKQVHVSDNEPSSEILSRSNTFESFPDSEEVGTADIHEKTPIESFDHLETCHMPAANSSFPEAAQALVDAIRRNRAYQKLLRRKLTEIEATIEQNKKHKKNVMIVKDFQASCVRITKQALSQRKDPRVELITARKSGPSDSFQGSDEKISHLTLGPPENPCAAIYRIALEKHPVSVDRRNWTTKEKEDLSKALKQHIQGKLIIEALERSSDLEGNTDDMNTIQESIKNLEITPEMIRQFVNWDQLDIKNRSGAECEARWMSSEDPLINHGPWTEAEDKKLCSIIEEKGFTDWRDIAESLGTNRTPFQCLARYQRSLNPVILGRDWTPEEDEQLRVAVDWFGEKDWQSVANVLHERTGPQCSNRWMKSLHPTRTTEGDWSSEELKCLKVAVTFFGAKNWHKIAQFVPGRTDVQCREKWKYSFDPNVKRGGWTEEEDAKLREATKVHGYSNWAKVALHVPGRDRKQCRRRWNYLNPHLASLIQEANKLRREATVGNFVDRESERPAVLSCDFLALAEISLAAEQPEVVAPKNKRKAREKKSDGAATERQPKRRRKGLERSSEDVSRQENESLSANEPNNEWHNEIQDNVKQKKHRKNRKNVAETLSNSSVITTNFPQVKSGIQKLKPRRKVSAVDPIENQAAPN